MQDKVKNHHNQQKNNSAINFYRLDRYTNLINFTFEMSVDFNGKKIQVHRVVFCRSNLWYLRIVHTELL